LPTVVKRGGERGSEEIEAQQKEKNQGVGLIKSRVKEPVKKNFPSDGFGITKKKEGVLTQT